MISGGDAISLNLFDVTMYLDEQNKTNRQIIHTGCPIKNTS